jgi:hypothetical protein
VGTIAGVATKRTVESKNKVVRINIFRDDFMLDRVVSVRVLNIVIGIKLGSTDSSFLNFDLLCFIKLKMLAA